MFWPIAVKYAARLNSNLVVHHTSVSLPPRYRLANPFLISCRDFSSKRYRTIVGDELQKPNQEDANIPSCGEGEEQVLENKDYLQMKEEKVTHRLTSPLHRDIFPLRSRRLKLHDPNLNDMEKSDTANKELGRTKSNTGSHRFHAVDANDDDCAAEEGEGDDGELDSEEGRALDEIIDPHDKRSELFPTDGLRVVATSQETEKAKQDRLLGYRVFRAMAPYIAVHRDSVMVIHIPGEVLESQLVDDILHDIVLLKTLGVKPVLVAGCRPQLRKRLAAFGIRSFFVKGNRVCDGETLGHCQSVAGHVRVEIESKLGRGLLNAPIGTGVGFVSVVSGNLVRAIPYGVRGGIDYKHTGVVQKVEGKRIMHLLNQGDIVLLGHLGYSQSAHVFHCRSEEVAVKAAIDLKAEKLVFLHNGESVVDINRGNALNISLKTS